MSVAEYLEEPGVRGEGAFDHRPSPLRHTRDERSCGFVQEMPDGNPQRILVGCMRTSVKVRRCRRSTQVQSRPFSWFNSRSGEAPFA